ncbi:hypothetical protein L9F63_020007, partial [Diploptera punctata]
AIGKTYPCGTAKAALIRTTTKKAYEQAYKHLKESKTPFYTHGATRCVRCSGERKVAEPAPSSSVNLYSVQCYQVYGPRKIGNQTSCIEKNKRSKNNLRSPYSWQFSPKPKLEQHSSSPGSTDNSNNSK